MRILLFKSESSIQISARERGSVWIEKCNYSGYGYVNSGSGRTACWAAAAQRWWQQL